jgi:hypothetical protein
MKLNYKRMLLPVTAGIVYGMTLPCFAPPNVFITAPAPAPSSTIAVVPDSYVWDGSEYVGIVAGQDYYLGPGDVWIPCSPAQVHRFQQYQASHPDWQSHMTTNEKYRYSNHGSGSTTSPGNAQSNPSTKYKKDNDYNDHTTPMRDMHNNQPINQPLKTHKDSDYNDHMNPP